MNDFIKQWITSTCAPESVININSNSTHRLDAISNEDKSIRIFVLSNNINIQAIGLDYNELLQSKQYSITDGISKISEMLKLKSF